MWKNRVSQLDNVPGFLNFNLIKGKTKDDFTIFASHSIWKSSSDFINWTNSKEIEMYIKMLAFISICILVIQNLKDLMLYYKIYSLLKENFL